MLAGLRDLAPCCRFDMKVPFNRNFRSHVGPRIFGFAGSPVMPGWRMQTQTSTLQRPKRKLSLTASERYTCHLPSCRYLS